MSREVDMNNLRELEFAIFVIEGIAARLGITGSQAYRLLTSGPDVLDTYVIPSYDALHTQGREYVVNDVLAVMERCAS